MNDTKPKESPIGILVATLKSDPEYRRAWKDNIAMAFKDNYYQYKKGKKKATMNAEDIHIVANNAADYFLKLVCDEIQYPEGR